MTTFAISLWQEGIPSFHWADFSTHYPAVALFVIYLIGHYRGWVIRQPTLLIKECGEIQTTIMCAGSSDGVEVALKSLPRSHEKLESPPSPVSSVSSSKSAGDENDIALAKECPEATECERERFLHAREGNVVAAATLLRNYLIWHLKHHEIAQANNIIPRDDSTLSTCPSDDKDLDVWTNACAVAMLSAGEKTDGIILPRVIRTYKIEGKDVTDIDGRRIIHIVPAKMDLALAASSTYALATALYLNMQMDRDGMERITVCMDVRAGRGWPNVHAMRLIPFMQQTTTLLLSLFPERLHRCVLYPVPSSFLWVWKAVSTVVDPLTRDKICLLTGVNKIESPPPFDQMYEYMEKEVAHLLEDCRIATFIN